MLQRILAGITLTLTLTLMLFGCNSGTTEGTQPGSTPGTGKSGETGNTSNDEAITKAVQAKIDVDAPLKAAGVQAKARGGQVELTGTVKAIADKDNAETIAREAIKPYSNINAGIVNNIQIAETESPAGASNPGAK